MSEPLIKAQEFDKNNKQEADLERPLFHITGAIGWINDPNGFSVYKNQYHMFFQYHPYDTNWGPMHWGHVVSEDLLDWNYKDIVLAPDCDQDINGCFSGTATTLKDGQHALLYTGVNKFNLQEQCIAIGNGTSYTKYDKNPIISCTSVPEGNSHVHFRDPKVWEENGIYYCIVGNMDARPDGQVLLYKSEDCFQWEFVSVFYSNEDHFGTMQECPDFFSIQGKDILITNPCNVQAMYDEFPSGHVTGAMLGVWDREENIFIKESLQNLDYGLDFYAPQSIEDQKGRRILIGWMQNWHTVKFEHENKHIYGCLSLPRVLTLKENRILQNPIEEIENYYDQSISINKNILLEESFDCIRGRFFDMEVTFENKKNMIFSIKIAQKENHFFFIQYNEMDNSLFIDRTYDGNISDMLNMRKKILFSKNDKTKLRILVDRNCVEIFVNEGENVFSNITYAPFEHEDISFSSSVATNVKIQFHTLKKPS